MNWVDLVLVLVVLLAIWGGWQRGFILGTLDLVNWIGSVILGFLFYPYLANFLNLVFPSLGAWLLPLSFFLTIILARILIGLVNSRIANKLSTEVEWVNEKLSPVFDKAIRQTINNLTIHPASNETVKLPFRDSHPAVRPDLETQMLQFVNEERTKRGLSPLKPDPELTEVARAHSRDMFARGYFAHFTPEGKSPFDRMNEAHVQYATAGENLALAHSLSIAHNGLMNSPGHRANILSPSFGHVGIGILDGGFYGLMVSQEFRN